MFSCIVKVLESENDCNKQNYRAGEHFGKEATELPRGRTLWEGSTRWKRKVTQRERTSLAPSLANV